MQLSFKIAKSYLRYNPNSDARVTSSGQSLSFIAFEGARYSVETIDPAYNYTKHSFVADKNASNKTVLLVEIGQKIRLDNTPEGKGSLIDEK